jgi:hypothetical protein
MIEARADQPSRITLGAEEGYDAEDFVNELRAMRHECDTPCGDKNQGFGHRRPYNPACGLWHKPAHPQKDRGALRLGQNRGPLAKTVLLGLERAGAQFVYTLATYKLARLPILAA